MHPLLNIGVQAARQASDFILRSMDQLDKIKVNQKAQAELFSEVDVRAEQMIIQTIHKAYPDHGIIAEESGKRHESAEVVWIIDPLDGTNNYLHAFPFFAVSIAVQVKGRIEHGVIYDPIRHECFTASRGAGAKLNDRRLRVSKQTQLKEALLGTGVRMQCEKSMQRYLQSFSALFGQCAGLRRTGSAALDLAYVAAGRLDGYWEFGLRNWDIAAGALMIQEAGGLVSDPQGGENFLNTGDIVAGTPKIFKPLLQTLFHTGD